MCYVYIPFISCGLNKQNSLKNRTGEFLLSTGTKLLCKDFQSSNSSIYNINKYNITSIKSMKI